MTTRFFGRGLNLTGGELGYKKDENDRRIIIPRGGKFSDPQVQKYVQRMTNHQRHRWAKAGYATGARKLAAVLRSK